MTPGIHRLALPLALSSTTIRDKLNIFVTNYISIKPQRLLAVAILFLFSSFAGRGATYFVAPNGDDVNAGTEAAPWQRIITAVTRSAPGDTLMLRGGTYTEGEIWIQQKSWGGAPGQFKIIRNYPGETPSLGGPRRLINQADWMRFEGLHFRLVYTFDNSGGDHVQLINCVFEGAQPDYGAVTFRGNHGLVEGNLVRITGDSANTLDHGIYLLHGAGNVIRANTILNATGYGIHIYDEHKSEDPAGFVRRFDRILIEGNYVEGSPHRSGIIATAHPSASMSNIVVRGNVLVGNNHAGLIIGQASGVGIERNTFYNNGLQGLSVYPEANSLEVRNNLFVQLPNNACRENCSWFARRHIGMASGAKDVRVMRNFYWPASVSSDGPADPEAVFGDPRFVDAAARDLRLLPESLACHGASDGGEFGALPCGAGLHLRASQFDQAPATWRVQAIGRPGDRIQFESATTWSNSSLIWTALGPPVTLPPAGAVIVEPISGNAPALFYRARTVSPAP